jgi:hypothetical protein
LCDGPDCDAVGATEIAFNLARSRAAHAEGWFTDGPDVCPRCLDDWSDE